MISFSKREQHFGGGSARITKWARIDLILDFDEAEEEAAATMLEIPTKELEQGVELKQPLEHEPPKYNLWQTRPWLQNADQQKGLQYDTPRGDGNSGSASG